MAVITFKQLGRFGALGNQLFQIASTIGIALVRGADARFPEWEYSRCFNMPQCYFSDEEGEDLGEDYLQDLRYFQGYEDLIRLYFQPSLPMFYDIVERYSEMIPVPNKTAVHIRRANNIFLPNHHPVCDLDYYEQAIDIVKPEQLVVFSDDLAWCKQQSLFRDAFFADGNDPSVDVMRLTDANPLSLSSAAMDLLFMARMESHIISNSTFSWWGAWLADKEVVIYPRPWYGRALSHIDVEGTIIPSHWIPVERQIP